jgi:hypothetical protein
MLTRVAMEVFEGLPQADLFAQISEGASVMQAMRRSVKEIAMGGESLYLAISTGNWHTIAGAIYASHELHNALGNVWYGASCALWGGQEAGGEARLSGRGAERRSVLGDNRVILTWPEEQ